MLLLIMVAGCGVFIQSLLIVMVGPLLVDMAEEFDVGVPLMGQLTAFMAITWLLVALVAGPISDVYGRKPVLLLGLIATVLGAIGTGLAWDFTSAALFRAISGLGGVVPPISTAAVVDHAPPNRRGRSVSLFTAVAGLSGVLGVPLATLLADAFSWRWSFIAVGLAGAMVWLVSAWLLPKPSTSPKASLNIDIFSRFSPLIRRRVIWDITLINACQRTGMMVLMTYFAPFLIVRHGFTTGQTALPMAIVSAGMIVASLVGGGLADTRFRLAALPVGMAASAVIGLAIFQIAPFPYLAVGLGLLYVSSIYFVFPIVITLFTTISGPRLRGTVMSLMPISNQSGIILGPAIGGLALSLGGYGAIGLACLAVGLVGALLATVLLRESRVREATTRLSTFQE